MANKRMFSMKIVDSDAFLDMPLSTQCLYFHLNMRADDDGFIGNVKRIMRIVGSSDDDLKLLIAKRFILTFEDGVIVIKHWRMHNTLSTGRYHETQYLDEKSMLLLKENGAYSFNSGNEIDDARLIESGKRLSQKQKEQRRTSDEHFDESSDEQVTHLDKDLGLGLDIYNNNMSENEQSNEHIFKQIWAVYPRKEGKGRVSKTQKKKLADIGLEQMTRCVERYKDKIKSEGIEKKYIQMGSTFFNSGYVDYLDENYEQAEQDKPKDLSKLSQQELFDMKMRGEI